MEKKSNKKHDSNITSKPFRLLDTDVGTVKVRRERAKRGVADAREDVTMTTTLDDPFADLASEQEGDSRGQKRERDEEVDAVTAGVKKLRCGPTAWESLDEMEWNERSGKLYGKWSFEGQR